jgi:rhodanese-related sulfurtransferase
MNPMTVKTISAEELYERVNNKKETVLLDVRAEEKYKDYHIQDANIENINIHKAGILSEQKADAIHDLPKEKEIIVTCTTGNSAGKCARILADMDYDVVVLEGGITAWKQYLETKR